MLNQYLKRYRISHNLSQAEMAELLGTSQSYYSRLETGDNKPGIQMVRRIAKLLNLEESFIRSLL